MAGNDDRRRGCVRGSDEAAATGVVEGNLTAPRATERRDLAVARVLLYDKREPEAAALPSRVESVGVACEPVGAEDLVRLAMRDCPQIAIIDAAVDDGCGLLLGTVLRRLAPFVPVLVHVEDAGSEYVEIADGLGLLSSIVLASDLDASLEQLVLGLVHLSASSRHVASKKGHRRGLSTGGCKHLPLVRLVQTLEESAIEVALARTGTIKGASRALGLLPQTLRGKMKKMRGQLLLPSVGEGENA